MGSPWTSYVLQGLFMSTSAGFISGFITRAWGEIFDSQYESIMERKTYTSAAFIGASWGVAVGMMSFPEVYVVKSVAQQVKWYHRGMMIIPPAIFVADVVYNNDYVKKILNGDKKLN